MSVSIGEGSPSINAVRRTVKRSRPGGLTMAGFSILSIFAASEKGIWLDPSDLSTVWQDSARTIPGAVNSVVGCLDDKSGNGNNATQGTTANKPILRQSGALYYLEFDGVDDFLITPTITPGINIAQFFAGIRKTTDVARAMLVEFGPSANLTATGGFNVNAPSANGASNFVWTASSGSAIALTGTPFAAGTPYVLTGTLNGAVDSTVFRINAAQVAISAGDLGAAGIAAKALYIGRRDGATLPFSGRVYGLVARFGADLSATQITQMESEMNSKAGAY